MTQTSFAELAAGRPSGHERFRCRLDQVVQLFLDPSEPIEPENYDDYRHTGAKEQENLGPLFENFCFCCESEDKMNLWAINAKVNRFGMTMKAFFGSDIGQTDSSDLIRMDEDTYELVHDDILMPEPHRASVADHTIRLRGRMNANFFKRTAIEGYADKVLCGSGV